MKTKFLKSIVFALAAIFTLSGMKIVMAENVKADLKNVNITINKRAFDGEKLPDDKQNTGNEMPDFGGVPLPGVVFTKYDVTAKYYELLSEEKTPEEAVSAIQSDFKNTVPDYGKNPVVSSETDNNGQTQFSDVSVFDSDTQHYKVYVFIETSNPKGVSEKSAPLVVVMPLYKGEDDKELISNIQLYPKNLLNNKVISKTKDDANTTTYDEGTVFDYTINVDVPTTAKDKLEIVDTSDPIGSLKLVDEENMVVSVDGKKYDKNNYTLVPTDDKNVFVIKFNKDVIPSLIGHEITVKYSVVITDKAPIDKPIHNNASVYTDGHDDPNNPDFPPYNPTPPGPDDPDPNPPVYTGGYKFRKQDFDTKKALSGAEFIVKNSQGKYAKYSVSGNSYTFIGWVDNQNQATTITSANDGTFEVKGMNNGTYSLIETKAPSGYVLPSEPINFTIKTGDEGHSYIDGDSSPAYNINNVHKGILPSTGGKGIYGFIALGLIIIVSGLIWYRKTNKTTEI